MKIVVNSMNFQGSFVNGPGVRSLLFLQGCDRRCEGCHNPSTWDIVDGVKYDIDELVELIKNHCLNRKITITGGEPLYQTVPLLELLEKLDGFDICLYTSYELEEVPQAILSRIRYIKTGKYLSQYHTSVEPYCGSSNQKFIEIYKGG